VELFSILEEKQLVKKIYAIHDKIFSCPAKKYVFCFKTKGDASGAAFGYYSVNDHVKQNVVCTGDIPEQKFGEKTIIVMFEKYEKCSNDIVFEKRFFDNIEHDHIIVKSDFLHFKQMLTLYWEALEHYNTNKKFKVTDLVSLEYTLKKMEEEKGHGRTYQATKKRLHFAHK